MADDLIRTIDTSEVMLNNLFKEVLDGLRDDIDEAKLNVERYTERIEKDQATLDMYGPLLNSALAIKGSARDKQLKFLNTFKERVTKKEAIELAKGEGKGNGNVNIVNMNEAIEKIMASKQQEKNISLDDDDDDEV